MKWSRWMGCAALLLAAGACAPAATRGPGGVALQSITREELREDLFAHAGDAARGREAGTLDELRAAAWLAERARAAGLEPAGDEGTYFQFFPVQRRRIAERSRASLAGAALRLWEELVPLAPVDARVDAPVVVLREGAPLPPAAEVAGRVVMLPLRAPAQPPRRDVSLWQWRYTMAAIREQAAALAASNPAAVVLVADSIAMQAFETLAHFQEGGSYRLDPAPASSAAPTFLMTPAAARRAAPGSRFTAELVGESFLYPSVNVVARAPGRDPALRDEHVLFSGHIDHDGVGHPVNGDSIWNGADDNATVNVALLAIGRAFARAPAPRSALFIWHGAEEKGLLGSRWFVERPTVPREQIVAVLNGDMIGRNHPDSAALLGSIPPHRNSADLVQAALDANRRATGFALDSTWDAPEHPERWYFRSDHLPYARAGIPAIFFTTLLHPDYHTPFDNPDRIDLDKLARMTRWMYATGWAVAAAPQRPALDPDFKLER